jgi:hypothetical protein
LIIAEDKRGIRDILLDQQQARKRVFCEDELLTVPQEWGIEQAAGMEPTEFALRFRIQVVPD